MDSIKKLATYGTQDEEKQSKNTTQYILFICMCLTPLYVTIDTGNKTKKNNPEKLATLGTQDIR
jgi:hypothetical protein